MLAFLQILALLIAMLPDLIKLMGTVQSALGTGTGSQKLEIVKNTVQTAYDVAQPTSVAFEAFWPKVATLIASIKKSFGADKLVEAATK
jgi:hypothetical protein